MFKVENNARIGEYLDDLILKHYPSKRAFCRAYLTASDEEPTEERIINMSNRLSQIKKGKKAIQTYDLPYFTELLGISCEQILSAGKYCSPLNQRITNYTIAASKDPVKWKAYIEHPEKLILNSDEYGKTVIDYALEFENYEFLKYLMDEGYIWFDSRDEKDYVWTFGAGTSIQPREIYAIDWGLKHKLCMEDNLRRDLIRLAVQREDLKMLEELRAREMPQLYHAAHYHSGNQPDFDQLFDKAMVQHIAQAGERVLDYFTDTFPIGDGIPYRDGHTRSHDFLFPYFSQLLDLLISQKAHFAETALKKAILHNKTTYNTLQHLMDTVKNDPYYAPEHMQAVWKKAFRDHLWFYSNGNIIQLQIFLPQQHHSLITNIVRVQQQTDDPVLKVLVNELNGLYDQIRNLWESPL